MIYTSYFTSRKYDSTNGVSIARWCSFWPGDKFPALAPSEKLLKWWRDLPLEKREDPFLQHAYREEYTESTLASLNVHEVAKALDGKVLLCFEKSEDFCHRHLVAEWLRKNGYECEEL